MAIFYHLENSFYKNKKTGDILTKKEYINFIESKVDTCFSSTSIKDDDLYNSFEELHTLMDNDYAPCNSKGIEI